MICDICKEKEAELFLKKNNKITSKKYYICKNCGEKLGISSDPARISENFSIVENFINKRNNSFTKTPLQNLTNLTKICPVCGSGLNEVLENGNPGCPECYHTFEEEFIKKYNIRAEYSGNLPKRLKGYRSTLTDRVDIREKMEIAIANEEYEKAALYRDYLKVLERKSNLNGETADYENSGNSGGKDDFKGERI